MPNFAIHLRRALVVLLTVCGLSHADKTLMWLTDWYQGNLDSVVITSVSIPHYGDTGAAKDGYYYGKTDLSLTRTNAYAPFIKVNSKVSNDGKPDSLKVPKLLARYWYAQPNFNDGNFKGGMVNVMVKFQSFNHTYQQGPPAHIQLDRRGNSTRAPPANLASSTVASTNTTPIPSGCTPRPRILRSVRAMWETASPALTTTPSLSKSAPSTSTTPGRERASTSSKAGSGTLSSRPPVGRAGRAQHSGPAPA